MNVSKNASHSTNRQRMDLVSMVFRSEGRTPKSERNPRTEIRIQKTARRFRLRISAFFSPRWRAVAAGRISDFGFRISCNAIALPAPRRDELRAEFFSNAEDVNIQEI